MKTVDNSTFDNSEYDPIKGIILRTVWYFVNASVFNTYLFPFYSLKSLILRAFGAQVGKNFVIKPSVNIKYPWLLDIGDNVWIGEGVWIDNLDKVTVGNNVCMSQGAFVLTGNHDYKSSSFGLITKPVKLKDGVWLGARSIVCPGITCGSHSILSVGSVATGNLKEFKIYSGNPATVVRERKVLS